MAERPYLSSRDFGIDALERNARSRPTGRSFLQTGASLPFARHPARQEGEEPATFRDTVRPKAAHVLPQPEAPHVASRSADEKSPATVEGLGNFLELDFRRLSAWLRAGLALACVLALAGAIAGGAYGLLGAKRFTVATDILVNPVNLQVLDNDLFQQPGQVDSQLLDARSKQRILTSRNVLSRVVDQLDLASDPEFAGSASAAAKRDPKLKALENLQKQVTAEADAGSFVTTLLVSAQTSEKAIGISQAIVKTFQEELAQRESESASRAAAALDGRLDRLKRDVMEAEEKVEAYRRGNDLASSNGQLVSSQTMTQLNTQIVQAQARVAAAQSSLDTLVAAGANGTNASSSESQTLADLRGQVNAARRELQSQSALLGPRHPSILRLKVALDTVSTQLNAEYRHTVDVAKADRDSAKSTLDALVKRMSDLRGGLFSDQASEVALRELERDAASRTAIYESSLARARQITERQQIDTTNVQVISEPVPPAGRSWPPRTIVLIMLGAFAGFAAGMLLALLRGVRGDLRRPSPPLAA